MRESWKKFLFAVTVIALVVVSVLGVIRFRSRYLAGNISDKNAAKDQTTQHSSNSLELVERSPTEQPTYEVRPVINRQYFDVLRRQINKADSNIKVSMYLFLPPKKGDPKRSPRGIIKALRKAASRGVKIQILLSKKDAPSVELSYVHKGVLEKLSHPNITGAIYSHFRTLHTKYVIFDKRTVLVGAHNWTYSALNNSHEVSLLIHSDRQLERLLKIFRRSFSKAKVVTKN